MRFVADMIVLLSTRVLGPRVGTFRPCSPGPRFSLLESIARFLTFGRHNAIFVSRPRKFITEPKSLIVLV